MVKRPPAGATFNALPGFDWDRVNWGRPDSQPSVLCSYCSAVLDDDDVPLIMFTADAHCAQFCGECMAKWFGLR